MKIIELTKGAKALVDDEDYDRVLKHSWSLHIGKYAACRYRTKHILMHRFILNPPLGLVVDHINGEGTDNRKSNLRICTQSQNCANSKNKRNGIYRGISRMRENWQAYIVVNHKKHHLGTFKTPEDAALAYDIGAIKHFGPYARLNFNNTATAV